MLYSHWSAVLFGGGEGGGVRGLGGGGRGTVRVAFFQRTYYKDGGGSIITRSPPPNIFSCLPISLAAALTEGGKGGVWGVCGGIYMSSLSRFLLSGQGAKQSLNLTYSRTHSTS